MCFTLSLLTSVILALQVTAQSFLTFNDNDCDGTQGLVVACDGTCFDFTGEHSFEVGDITFFKGANCTRESFNFSAEAAGECINVNTGTNIQSFICT
ncbi:hypothetical protein B0H10DRAFT_1781437 [Mycena sp. CBHHK59/15]|nr:hypothetical protein B0H10DRAFT_1806298 [Mycena sp. CBHHK59/15]KAJ6626428.1 hypothetical protein B0H10DRAFT_1781437 [Mycena sp. CBHHK59/15]